MNAKLVNRSLNILLKYKKIFPEKDINGLLQFYIDRYNDSVKAVDTQIETEVVLNSLDIVKQMI
jgi:hypothetical protein